MRMKIELEHPVDALATLAQWRRAAGGAPS
jgi:hypothetical protein